MYETAMESLYKFVASFVATAKTVNFEKDELISIGQ
jgi:hypothetical protein